MHVIIVFAVYLCTFAYIVHIRTYLKKMRSAICYKMNVSRASGAACGSSYGRFCIFIENKLKPVLVEIPAETFVTTGKSLRPPPH